MNNLNVPGFTAEAALYIAYGHYRMCGVYQQFEQVVQIADFVDYNCLSQCKKNCGLYCSIAGSPDKVSCIRECAIENKECESSCTRPGSRPPGGGGGMPGGGGGTSGTGADPCANRCENGICCPADTVCAEVAGTFVCCQKDAPIAIELPHPLGIRCVWSWLLLRPSSQA